MLLSVIHVLYMSHLLLLFFFFQAEDGIRDLVRSRGLGDVYKRQDLLNRASSDGRVTGTEQSLRDTEALIQRWHGKDRLGYAITPRFAPTCTCLLYTSDAADERSSVDLGGRRIIKKKKRKRTEHSTNIK